jgi:diphosphomevalonate decarboxylase
VKQDGDIIYVEARSPINIALVKYWSKADSSLIIPSNASFSVTLNKDDLCSQTTVKLMPTKNGNVELILNGKSEKISERIKNMINTVRDLAKG